MQIGQEIIHKVNLEKNYNGQLADFQQRNFFDNFNSAVC